MSDLLSGEQKNVDMFFKERLVPKDDTLEETTISNRECATNNRKKNISLASQRNPKRNKSTGAVKGKDHTPSKRRKVKLVSTSASGMSAHGVAVVI